MGISRDDCYAHGRGDRGPGKHGRLRDGDVATINERLVDEEQGNCIADAAEARRADEIAQGDVIREPSGPGFDARSANASDIPSGLPIASPRTTPTTIRHASGADRSRERLTPEAENANSGSIR